MYPVFFQLLYRINFGPHLFLTVAGIVLVHLAAYLLFTAVAPYAGCFFSMLGFLCYATGSRRPILKPLNNKQNTSAVFEG